MSKSPLVSVVVPAYNGEEFIAEAIGSVLAQTYENFEVVVVDDGSSDDTVGIVREYDDDRVSVHLNEENLGIARNMNRGAELADGEILSFLDQDDKWDERKLARHIQKHEIEDAAVVYSDVEVVSPDGTRLERVAPPEPKPPGEPLVQQLYVHLNFVRTFSSVTIEQDAWIDVGGLDTTFAVSADYDLYLRLAESYKFAHLAEPLTMKRKHERNTSGDYRALYNDVQTILQEVRQSNPKITQLSRKKRAEYHFQQAFCAFRADKVREAFEHARKSVKSYPRLVSVVLLFFSILDLFTGPLRAGTRGYRLYLHLKAQIPRDRWLDT